jgi:WD40 repeat protein
MRLLTEEGSPIWKLAFSPDGRWLLVTTRPDDEEVFVYDAVRLWDLSAGTMQVLPNLYEPVFGNNGRTVIGFSSTSTQTLAYHAVFTPDGRSVLYAGWDNGKPPQATLLLFDLASGTTAPLKIPGHETQDFYRALFIPDGGRFVSLGRGESRTGLNNAYVLNWTTYPGWQPVGQWRVGEEVGSALVRLNTFAAFNPSGKTLATVGTPGVVLFDVKTGKQTLRKEVQLKHDARFLAYQPDGRRVAIGSAARVFVFDTRTWAEVAELRQSRKHFLSGAFTPDGRYFLTASNEETVKCWDTTSWTLTREYAWEIGGLKSVVVAPDGMTAAAGGDTAEIVVFDLDD